MQFEIEVGAAVLDYNEAENSPLQGRKNPPATVRGRYTSKFRLKMRPSAWARLSDAPTTVRTGQGLGMASSHMWWEIFQSPLGCFLRTFRKVPLCEALVVAPPSTVVQATSWEPQA
jgi:hypothetical protein